MMQIANRKNGWLQAVNATFAGVVGLLAAAGCGSKVREVVVGGETGFLAACGSDADCKSGLCACGVCSRTCEEPSDCDDERAECASGEAACAGEERSVCVPKAASSDASSGQPTEPSSGATSQACRGKGHYEAGKEGSYLPCCEGLTEVFHLSPAEGDDGPVCVDLPLRVYACVEGECGDGVCEVGEDVACGCADDCPGAVWTDTAEPVSTSSATSSDSTAACSDFTCQADGIELLSESPGSVSVRVEIVGDYCAPSYFGSAVTLIHQASGGIVPRGANWDDAHLCEDECPGAPPPVIPAASTEPFTWDGRATIADAMDTCQYPPDRPCQTVPQYAPPGRYLARICSVCDGQEEACAQTEFEFPQSEEVVLVIDTTHAASGDLDAGEPQPRDAGLEPPFDGALGLL